MTNNDGELCASAFRIYLTYALQETEASLVDYRLKMRISLSTAEKADWQRVIDAALRVTTYITNCNHDSQRKVMYVRGAYGLCAISAAQDVLASLLVTAESSYFNDSPSHRAACPSHEHTFRAKCFVNALVSLNVGSCDVSVLWVEAAQRVLLLCKQRRLDKLAKDWSVIGIPELSNLSKASTLTVQAAVQSSPEVSELCMQAARNYRLCAVHAVMGRQTNHQYAATTLETASQYYLRSIKCTGLARELWQRAASLMRLAAESIEAQAFIVPFPSDTIAVQNISAASLCASDAEDAHKEFVYLESLAVAHSQAVSLTGKCKVTAALPVLQALVTAHNNVRQLWEAYSLTRLACDDSSAASAVLQQFATAKANLTDMSAGVDELHVSIERAAFYRSKADKCDQIKNPSLHALWHQCWASAARHTDEVVQISACAIRDGVVQTLPPEVESQRQLSLLKSRAYAYGVNGILGDAACCLKPTHCTDARVDVWLRTAAEHLEQATRQYMDDICGHDTADTVPIAPSFPLMSRSTYDTVSLAVPYYTAARYLQLSIMTTEAVVQEVWTARVSELYMTAAELWMATIDAEGFRRTSCQRAVELCVALVDEISSESSGTASEIITMTERGVSCARSYLNATPGRTDITSMWMTAVDANFEAIESRKTNGVGEHAATLEASAALHVGAAVALTADKAYDSRVLSFAGEIMDDALSLLDTNKFGAGCCVELAKSICKSLSDPLVVPAELTRLPNTVNEAKVDIVLRHVAAACLIRSECDLHISIGSGSEQKESAWKQASTEAEQLIGNLANLEQHWTENTTANARYIKFEEGLVLQAASLRCCVAAARSDLNVWNEAVSVCVEVKQMNTSWSQTAAAMIDRYAAAAQALEHNDTGLHTLHTTAARAARKALHNLQNNVTNRQCADEYLLRAADNRVLALLTKRQGKHELAAVYTQCADLLSELDDYTNTDWDSWATFIQQPRRAAILAQISQLEARAAVLSAQAPTTDSSPDQSGATTSTEVAAGWRQSIAAVFGWS